MEAIARLLRKLSLLLHRDRFRSDLDEEMAFHREQAEQQLRSEGATPEHAHRTAARQFGNPAHLREQSHHIIGFRFEDIAQDLRFALRQLRRNPGFAITAIAVLALGMAASLAIFAFVDAALLKPLPYKDSSRLVGVFETTTLCPTCNLSYQDYLDYKKDNKVLSSLDAWGFSHFLWRGSSGVQPMPGVRVAGGFFHTLGVTPLLGRVLTESDDTPSAPQTVLLSFNAWQRRFGGNPRIIGQSIILDDASYTVVGVLPREFHFAPRGSAEVWTTLHTPTACEQRRSCHGLYGIGRLKDGVSIPTALADLKTIAAQLEKEYPGSNLGQGALIISLSDAIVGDVRPILLVLLCGAGLLLLIACINVASLLLVRAESRAREMAVRGALGASTARLMRQFITEGVTLVAIATVLGIAAAAASIHLLLKLIPTDMLSGMPYLQGLGVGSHVLLAAACIAILAVVVFSLTPTLRLSASNLRSNLADGARGSSGTAWKHFGSNLVALELAIAMVLLASAGLLGKSFYRLLHVDLNFQSDRLATLHVVAPDLHYSKDEQTIALSRQVVARLSAMPGVLAVAHTSMLPATCNCNTTWFRILGKPWHGEHNDSPQREVSAGYFSAIHARLLRGRFFTETEDAAKPHVVIVNQSLARQFFPNEDPIGKTLANIDLDPKSFIQIVGVVDDIREASLDQTIRSVIYYPFNQTPENEFDVVVHTAQDPAAMLPSFVSAIRQIDPGLGVSNEATMEQVIADSQTAYLHRSSAWLVGAFAVLALVLSVVGLYGVIAYSVSQRTREIGVRMALGAQRSTVYSLILKQAGILIGVGLTVGLLCSIAAASLMGKLLFGTRAWDLPTLAAVAAVLALAALPASFIPARRAASVNPTEALRAE